MARPRLFATSDLHVAHPANWLIVEDLRGSFEQDWLIVAGDVAESVDDIQWTLHRLRDRFAKVIWAPGNHELYTLPGDRLQLRGEARYRHLVELCRGLDVVTPEDSYPVWDDGDEQVVVAPLFVLYDYSFRTAGSSKQQALARAYRAAVVCTDELVLHPDPYPTREAWCRARVEFTRRRLADIPSTRRTVLVSHFPLHRAATRMLRRPEFAIWCGTELTEDWHRRFRAAVVVYGHLHIPTSHWHDGVRFEEVSLGYPREWRRRGPNPDVLRRILPTTIGDPA